jgi:hypothetical protein
MFPTLRAAMPSIIHDATINGMRQSELWLTYKDRIMNCPTKESFRVLVNRAGVSKNIAKIKDNRRELHKVRKAVAVKQAKRIVEKKVEVMSQPGKLLSRLADRSAEIVIEKELKGAKLHLQRMERIVEKAHVAMESINPTKGDLQGYIYTAKQFDELARKTFGMNGSEVVSPHQSNLAIVVNIGTVLGAGSSQAQLTERVANAKDFTTEADLIEEDGN